MLELFLIIHLLICLLLYVLMRIHILRCSRMIMPLAVFVPVWGIGTLLVLEIRTRGKGEIREEVGIEKLLNNDEVYRSILMEEDTTEDRVVPLEEALLINDPSMRRELMLDIMYDDPEKYSDQLLSARTNDDTEVVHYAVTALAQMQTRYDVQFQELEREMVRRPEDLRLTEDYLSLLKRYLGSGLAEGNNRRIRLRRYAALLKEKAGREPESVSWRYALAEAELELGEYEAAREDMEQIIRQWPAEESGYLLLIDYFAQMRDRDGIDAVLSEIQKQQVYLSAAGREKVQFWNGAGALESGDGTRPRTEGGARDAGTDKGGHHAEV
ncbi:MAG: hypothetical protein LUH00_08910 [Lachnospiraceae bacterium]|nr:hypothetical protein [Lachnospiraceae bacterium]